MAKSRFVYVLSSGDMYEGTVPTCAYATQVQAKRAVYKMTADQDYWALSRSDKFVLRWDNSYSHGRIEVTRVPMERLLK